MSARVISNLTGTGTLWNSGGNKALSDQFQWQTSLPLCEDEEGPVWLGPARQLATPVFTEDLQGPGTRLRALQERSHLTRPENTQDA